MGPPKEHADVSVKHPPGEEHANDRAKHPPGLEATVDSEEKEDNMQQSCWSDNLGRSGQRHWRDNLLEDEAAERAEREQTKKRVEFVKVALAAHDQKVQDKKWKNLPRWKVIKEDDVTETPTFVDSGSNVNVCSEDTARYLEDLGFVYKVRKPGDARDSIVFGKSDARSEIIGYVKGEGLIDRLAVVKDIEANLISVSTFTSLGMKVEFGDADVKVLDGDTLRFKGYKDPESQLYEVDIVDLLLTPGDDLEDGETTDESGSEEESETERRAGPTRGRGKEKRKWSAAYTARTKPRFKAQAIKRAMELHRHMKHIPLAIMANNIECGAWTGLDPMITPQLLRELAAQNRCLVCAAARWNQKIHKGSGTRVYLPGEAFALDHQGLISPLSFGCNGFIVIRDLGTGFFEVYGVRDKRAVTEAVRQWVTFMLSFGHKPKFGRHDSGAVETGQEFREALAALGIDTIASPPEIPEKNIERTVQTIQNDIAAMMISTPSFGARDWLFAAKHSAKMRSTMVCAASKAHHPSKSPYELICRKKPRMDLLTDIAVGDITVIRTPLKHRRLGMPRNQVARIMEVELDDARAAKVQVLGSERIVRRGNLQKVHVEVAEEATTGRPLRVVTMVTGADGKTTVTASPGMTATSIEDVARQEIALEDARELAEVDQIKERLRRANAPESDGEESAGEEERAGPAGGARDERILWRMESDEKADAGVYMSDKDKQDTGDGGAAGQQGDHHGYYNGEDYWASDEETVGEESQQTKAMAFWARQLQGGRKIPDQDTVDEVWLYSVVTGGAMPTDELMQRATGSPPRNAGSQGGGGTDTNGDESDSDDDWGDVCGYDSEDEGADKRGDDAGGEGHHPYFRALKARKVRDETCPTNRMLQKDLELHVEWMDADIEEVNGLYKVTDRVSEERARKVGVTPHVTDRHTKRSGRKKTRIAINGSFEVKQGRFPNKNALHSPAMDDELLKLTVQFATHFRMDMESSDITQCFTHSPMKGARFERAIVIHLSELESGVKGGEYREFNAVSYGTADASSEWYRNYKKGMLEMGFRVSVFHPCLFIKPVAEKSLIIVSVATDDMLKASTRDNEGRQALAQFNAEMGRRWPVTHEVPIKEMIGVKIVRHEDGSTTLTQPAEIDKIRKVFFGDGPAPEVLVPCHPLIQATAIGIEEETDNYYDEPVPEAEYRTKLGTLGYIRVTRHDALVTLSLLAERAHRPTRRFLLGLYWLAAYLVTTAEVGLTFQPGPEDADIRKVLEWSFFGDCSWATRDKGASCMGAAVVLGNYASEEDRLRRPFTAPVTAKSIKETGPPSDSASAGELQATVMALNMGMIIRGMSEELADVVKHNETSSAPAGMATDSPLFVTARASDEEEEHSDAREDEGDEERRTLPSPLMLDNHSLGMVLDLETTKKPKHLRKLSRLIAYVRWHEEQGLAKVALVRDPQQRADPLTKITKSPSRHWQTVEWIQGTHEQVTHFQQLATQRGQAREGTLEQQRQIRECLEQQTPRQSRRHYAGLATVANMQRSLSSEESITETTQRRLRNTIENAQQSALTKNLLARMRRDTTTEPRSEGGRPNKVRKLTSDEKEQLRIDRGWHEWQRVDAELAATKRARTEAEAKAKSKAKAQKRYEERFPDHDVQMGAGEDATAPATRKSRRETEEDQSTTGARDNNTNDAKAPRRERGKSRGLKHKGRQNWTWQNGREDPRAAAGT